jgi:cardiolipin synthase
LQDPLSFLGPLGWAILLADFVGCLHVLLSERRDPTRVVAWMLAILLLPLAGLVLYLLFGVHYFRARRFAAKRRIEQELLARPEAAPRFEPLYGRSRVDTGKGSSFLAVARALQGDRAAYLTSGNAVRCLDQGELYFRSLQEDIGRARSHVHLEFYIFRDAGIGGEILELLAQKAKEGCEVRLLVDNLGVGFSRPIRARLKEAGVHVAYFYRSPIPFLGLRLNYRNHRKIAVIDGKVGYVGGFNVGDEYLGRGPLGAWGTARI